MNAYVPIMIGLTTVTLCFRTVPRCVESPNDAAGVVAGILSEQLNADTSERQLHAQEPDSQHEKISCFCYTQQFLILRV